MSRLAALFLLVLPLGPVLSADYNLDISLAKVKFGDPLLGELRADDLAGSVVLVEIWRINCPHCLTSLPRMAALYRDLGPRGLLVVAPLSEKAPDARVKAVALARGVDFPVVRHADVPGTQDLDGVPHVLLFDHKGKCIFRGHPNKVESVARKAVFAALADVKGLPVAVAATVGSLKRGADPDQVLKEALELAQSSDKDVAEGGRKLVEHLTAGARRMLRRAEKGDSVSAFETAERIGELFEGTPVGKNAGELQEKLKTDSSVALELKVRPALASVRKLETTIRVRAKGKIDPSSEAFQSDNARELRQLRTKLASMVKAAPKARATAEAVRIASGFGIRAGHTP